jgi:hypothetical protein
MSSSLSPQDLSKAIQFLKDNAIRPEAVSLERLVGWLNNPLHKRKGFDIVETNLHKTGESNEIT